MKCTGQRKGHRMTDFLKLGSLALVAILAAMAANFARDAAY
ncbi:MAG: hypothetical protein ACI9IV_002579, partial [Paracoccaceae bacterium]